MSGEFGQYSSGYLHSQTLYAAEDCEQSSCDVGKALASIFRALHPITEGLCWYEAGDSGQGYPINAAIRHFDALRAAVDGLDKVLEPYREIIEDAIAEHITKAAKAE